MSSAKVEPKDGYAAVRDGGTGLIDLSSRARIRVGGSEAVMFLNGLITNDVKNLGANRWMPAVFPTVQGRLIGAVRVIRGAAPEFLIDTEAATHEAVLKTISRFTLAGDFKVTDVTTETASLAVQGKGSAELIEKVLTAVAADLPRNGVVESEWQSVPLTIARATHTAEDGFDVIVHASRVAELRAALEAGGATPVSDDEFDTLRIEAGVARFGRDMDETNVVPETNLDDAVSYTKGCYVGQEIIVRIKHRGHPAKKLTGLSLDTERRLEPGAVIRTAGNNDIGRVTSATVSPKLGGIALGYVRYEFLEPGTSVTVDNDVSGTVTELPLIRGSWYDE